MKTVSTAPSTIADKAGQNALNFDICGFKLNRTVAHVLGGVGIAFISCTNPKIKAFADYYLVNPSIFLPLIFAEAGMTFLGWEILKNSGEGNSTGIKLLKCSICLFAFMTIATIALDLKYD